MDSLYVCHFCNGHIKVGRSVEPMARIASHAERVSCIGIELSEHFIVACVGPSEPREALLIQRCTGAATARNKNEWFTGLDYLDVCEWASEAASALVEPARPVPSESILGYLKRRLGEAGPAQWEQIAAATGVNVGLPRKVFYEDRNFGVKNIQPLYDYFRQRETEGA